MVIKGFENEDIEVSEFGEWVGNDYIDYKADYKEHKKIISALFKQRQELIDYLNKKIKHIDDLINKSKPKPYGEELNLYENSRLRYLEILSKIEKE